jgi:hypothetical protein
MTLLTATICRADEVFPVVHNETITIRVLSGKDGLPLVYLHLIVIAGYDQSDLRDQLFREEAITDAHGQARLSNQLTNLPWLQVWVLKKPLCQANPRKASFSMERIRRDGLSASNRCGTIAVEDAPGVFTVFVKGKGKAPVALAAAAAAAAAPASAPASALATAPAASPAPCSCAVAKKTSKVTSVCDRVGHVWDSFAQSFRQ